MSNENRRHKLVLKTLGMEHLKQYNQLLRYAFQVTSRDLFDSGYDEEGELIRSKRPVLERAEVIGWFNEDRLVSQLSIYPCLVNIHGALCPMGGLTGVGTYPEYANMGLMAGLIEVALERMRAKGQNISYLYPYSVPFYRDKGWEIMSEQLKFKILDSQLPRAVPVPGYVERLPVTHPDVTDTYDRFSRQNHGAMIRGEVEWEEYWRWENEEERTAAVYYESEGKPLGYMLYWVARDVFHVKEMIYLSQEARLGLWNFITAHFSMISSVEGNVFKNDPIAFLMDDSQIVETIEPYYMARIVDVAAFLETFPFARPLPPDQPFHFLVSDPVARWNNGLFSPRSENGRVIVRRQAEGAAVRLDIRALSSMLMNFRRPSWFREINRVDTDDRTLELLEDLIPDAVPYFSDYF